MLCFDGGWSASSACGDIGRVTEHILLPDPMPYACVRISVGVVLGSCKNASELTVCCVLILASAAAAAPAGLLLFSRPRSCG
jgi:hypothetical protein